MWLQRGSQNDDLNDDLGASKRTAADRRSLLIKGREARFQTGPLVTREYRGFLRALLHDLPMQREIKAVAFDFFRHT
jgi:hypothetical protein